MGSKRINARYAPMDRSGIPVFLNPMPHVDWLTYLPLFKDKREMMLLYIYSGFIFMYISLGLIFLRSI